MARFVPRDARVPRILVAADAVPARLKADEEARNMTLVLVRFDDWPEDSVFAHGRFEEALGPIGNIEGETVSILREFNVDSSEFPDEVCHCIVSTYAHASSLTRCCPCSLAQITEELPEVPAEGEWQIPEEEIAARRDLRTARIFSIDPPTARDLDDALSCVALDDGTFEVGVHIADVSFFVKPGTKLDEIAARRATTTYLVQRSYPMLPRLLCENLCSLSENQDRLAYSVVWTLDREGNILQEWFGRTVIHSCCKLAYGHAQAVIEDPAVDWEGNEFPRIYGEHTIDDVKKDILNLQAIAVNLRARRFEGGALRLDKPKLVCCFGWCLAHKC